MAVFDGWESCFLSLSRFSSMARCLDMGAVDIQEGKDRWRMRVWGKIKLLICEKGVVLCLSDKSGVVSFRYGMLSRVASGMAVTVGGMGEHGGLVIW